MNISTFVSRWRSLIVRGDPPLSPRPRIHERKAATVTSKDNGIVTSQGGKDLYFCWGSLSHQGYYPRIVSCERYRGSKSIRIAKILPYSGLDLATANQLINQIESHRHDWLLKALEDAAVGEDNETLDFLRREFRGTEGSLRMMTLLSKEPDGGRSMFENLSKVFKPGVLLLP